MGARAHGGLENGGSSLNPQCQLFSSVLSATHTPVKVLLGSQAFPHPLLREVAPSIVPMALDHDRQTFLSVIAQDTGAHPDPWPEELSPDLPAPP